MSVLGKSDLANSEWTQSVLEKNELGTQHNPNNHPTFDIPKFKNKNKKWWSWISGDFMVFFDQKQKSKQAAGQITVHSESIQTPSLFPHFVTLQPYSKIDFFSLINLHTILQNDKVKKGF